MDTPELRKYSLVECRITRHQHYGLVVRTVPGDQPGFVDSSAISDQPYASPADWPVAGETLMCVILGDTRDGRFRLSSRPRDVALARAVTDVKAVLSTWQGIRDEGIRDEGRLAEFFKSGDAVPTLRWALSGPDGSADQTCASQIVAKAPDWLVKKLGAK